MSRFDRDHAPYPAPLTPADQDRLAQRQGEETLKEAPADTIAGLQAQIYRIQAATGLGPGRHLRCGPYSEKLRRLRAEEERE